MVAAASRVAVDVAIGGQSFAFPRQALYARPQQEHEEKDECAQERACKAPKHGIILPDRQIP